MTNPNTAQPILTPISVDYTNRDFYSLRDQLITRIQNRVPNWVGSDSSDFGVALVEAFSYMGDITAYYTDRVANEGSLLTASQRSSVINLALTYGYTPAGYSSATCTLTIQNTNGSAQTLPSGTQVSGQLTVNDTVQTIRFTTTADVTIPGRGSNTVAAQHGYYVSSTYTASDSNDIAGETIGVGDGTPNQQYRLASNQVVDGSVRVFVKNGLNYGEWTLVPHIADYGPTSPVFSVVTNADNYVTVIFGDGVSGTIPPNNETIKVEYLIGGGVIGNISQFGIDKVTAQLNTLYKVPGYTTTPTGFVISNSAATGGADPDDLNTIKTLGPQAYSAANRAITLNDYAGLSLRLPLVGKANAVSASSNSVTVYVAPRVVDTTNNPYPIFNSTNTALDAINWPLLQSAVFTELDAKRPIGVSVTVSPPKYVPVTMVVRFTKLPQYTVDQVTSQLTSLLTAFYNYNAVSFNQTIYPEDIEFLLKYAPGVSNVNVDALYRTGGIVGRYSLIGLANEIFSFNPTAVTLAASSSDTTLATLVASIGTFYPTYSATTSIRAYTLAVTPTTTAALTITPSATSGANTQMFINGSSVASGTAVNLNINTVPLSITAISSGTVTASITAITASSPAIGYVTYTATNNFNPGDVVTVSAAGGFNVTNATVYSATSSTFTLVNAITGVTTTGTVTASAVTYTATHNLIPDQIVSITGATSSGYNLTNVPVYSVVGTSTFTIINTATGSTSTAIGSSNVTISAISYVLNSGVGTITYTANNSFTAGEWVTITGATSSVYNLTNAIVASANSTQFTVTQLAPGGVTSMAVAPAYGVTTPIPIKVIAQDRSTTDTYTVAIVKS